MLRIKYIEYEYVVSTEFFNQSSQRLPDRKCVAQDGPTDEHHQA